MKYKGKNESRTVYGVLLHLDDYHELVTILRGENFDLDITADEYELADGEDEITQITKPFIRKLTVSSRTKSRDSTLYIRIEGSEAYVSFTAPDSQYGRALHVLEFLKSKRLGSRRLNDWLFRQVWLLLVGPAITTASVNAFWERIRPLPAVQRVAVLVVAFLPVTVFYAVGLRRHTERWKNRRAALILKERSEQIGFFQRHKELLEKLGIAVIAALVGAWAKSLFGK